MGPSYVRTFALGCLLLAVASCGGGATRAAEPRSDSSPNGDVVREWNVAAYEAAIVDNGYFLRLLFDDRTFTAVALAQHDALNSIEPRYDAYAYIGSHPGADPVAAAAQAARDVLAASFPKQVASFDQRLSTWLAKTPDGPERAAGIAAGIAAAAAVLAKRTDDGVEAVAEYTPGPIPAWQFTPPLDKVAVGTEWPKVRTFALTTADQFRPGPPPELTSATYTADFNEVKAVGARDSKTRSADETNYGQFWYEFSGVGWARVARAVTEAKKSDAWETARVFALVYMALFDSYISGFDAKYFYARTAGWRPYTAIRMAEADGNPATAADPAWEPFLDTPAVPDYPSTHSALGGGASSVLVAIYGDETPFSFRSGTGVVGVVPRLGPSTMGSPVSEPRPFKTFSQAAEENANSRVIIGIHFRFACRAGLELGRKVGAWTIANHLKPRAAR